MKKSLPARNDLMAALVILAIAVTGYAVSASNAKALPTLLLQEGSSMAGYSGGEGPEAAQRCRGILRSIGSSQLAYSSFYGAGRYGTFEDLKLVDFIAGNYTNENIVPGYSLGWFLNQDESDFMIAAIPSETEGMQAYAIDSRQTLLRISPIEDVPQPDGWEHIFQIQGEGYADIGRYVWPEVLESEDPPREFNVFLSDDGQVYLVALIAPFIDFSAITLKPEAEYIFVSDDGVYYIVEPDEELELYPEGY